MKAIVTVMAMAALEDWTITVRTVPTATKMRNDKNPLSVKFCKKDKISGLALMSGTESFKNINPRKSNPKPTSISPKSLRFFIFDKIKGRPTPTMGRAMAVILNLKPITETIQVVTVVPILAPIITPIACTSESKEALTKLTTMTVVAEDDCIKEVVKNPVKIATNLF